MGVDHYENFPVASWLCPPRMRPAIVAIYRFARTADDIADEGDAPSAARLADLAAMRADLVAAATGREGSLRWSDVFVPLAAAMARHSLPIEPFAALLDAFAEDAVATRYADRPALLAYCRCSADPIGRLLLHLYGVDDAPSLARSDAICTGLQLANFWQDLGVDVRRGRLFVPESDCRKHGVDPSRLLARHGGSDVDSRAGDDGPDVHALVGDLVGWARSLLWAGAPLVHTVGGRAGLELRFVVQGGLRILERIDRLGGATLAARPRLGWTDAPVLAWRALAMRRGEGHGTSGVRPSIDG